MIFLVKEKDDENHKYVAKVLTQYDKNFDNIIILIKKIQNFKNPYVIKYITSSDNGIIKTIKNRKYIIYEYASKLSLFDYLMKPNKNYFEEKYAKIIFKYILKGF